MIARLTDLGWGGQLRERFTPGAADAEIDERLLGAVVTTLREWPWEQRPTAVVAMPSETRPLLVASTAARISELGRLPLLGTVTADPTVPVTGPGGNSAFRLASVWNRFSLNEEVTAAVAANNGPVLLVDDLIDSRWSITVASRLLRRAGADAVLPFALASVA